MKHLSKILKRKKPSKPPQQPNTVGNPAAVAAGPPAFRVEQDVVPDVLPDDGSEIVPQTPFQSGTEDIDQEPLVSGARASGVTTGEADSGNHPTIEGSSDAGGVGIEPLQASDVTRRAREGTLPGGARDGTKKFGPLKAAMGAILDLYADREESVAGNKIQNLLSRINALEERFDLPPSDVAEQRRRGELIDKLGGIEGQLRLLSEESGSSELTDRVQSCKNGIQLLEDLQEAIFHYQMAQRRMTGDQGFRTMDPAEATVLNNVRCAQHAEYRHGNRIGCLKGTRTGILDGIELWTRDFEKPSIYWLNGLAGTGKSTIAQTIAERIFADGRLGASFFCSRDYEDRSDLQLIFPTLAVQLARKYTEFRSTFIQLVQPDPEIVHESLYGQMKNLIVQPLVESALSTVIVIDALDECKDEEPASAILSVLGQFVAEIPTVKFFITGRPEPRIQGGFRLPLLAKATDVFLLHDVDPGQVYSDIRLFFTHGFSELKSRRYGLDDWPTAEQVDVLCERAAGLFVYAMATIRFIDQKNSCPRKQLDRLRQAQGNSVLEGKTKFKANATLDSLYTSILQEAFGDDDPENDPKVRSVLGAVVLAANPLSPSSIATLLGLGSGEVFPLLSSIHSLLVFQQVVDHPVRPFHKSFPDFVVDPARCGNQRFRVCPSDHHTELLLGCLETMNRELERNVCGLPDGVTNSEVVDLKDRVKEHVSQALEYACRSWHKHLIGTIPAHVAPVLHQFLETKFLFWLEVLSVIGAAREAVDALEATVECKWQDVSPTLDLVRDYLRFVTEFFEVIKMSAQHIYHSALLLSPKTSIVRGLFKQYACPFARVVRGLPLSWEPISASKYLGDFGVGVWSPCGKFIVVPKPGSTEILDSVTLNRLSIFETPTDFCDRSFSFTPDGRFLTRFDSRGLITWDFQTGCPLSPVRPGLRPFSTYLHLSSTCSMDGKLIAVAYEDYPEHDEDDDNYHHPNHDISIAIFDLFDTARIHTHKVLEGSFVPPIWTHGQCFRFATIKPSSIIIWEVAFASTHGPAEVESLPVPDEIAGWGHFLFFPPLSRLAFLIGDRIRIWDAKSSKLFKPEAWSEFLSVPVAQFPWGSFSFDGHFFACVVDIGVCVWKESPSGYILHQKLTFANSIGSEAPRFSSDGESIITSAGSMIHLWPTRDQIFSPSNTSYWDGDIRDGFILGFSPNELFVVFAKWKNGDITILDLQSGDLLSVISMNVEIGCLWMTETTIVAVDQEKIVSWNLPVEDRSAKSWADIKNTVQPTTLDYSPQPPSPFSMSVSPDLSRIIISTTPPNALKIYDVSTGGCLGGIRAFNWPMSRFTHDGRQIWDVDSLDGWEIVEDSKSGTIELKPLEQTAHLPGLFPLHSSHGYDVTDDGWVLSPTQKRLLWLPQRWRSTWKKRAWSGRFLGLLHCELSEPVILEFFE